MGAICRIPFTPQPSLILSAVTREYNCNFRG